MSKSWIQAVGLAVLVALTGGCAAVVVGGVAAGGAVGGYAYVNGEMQTTLEASMDRSWNAAQAAMKDLQFTIKERQKDAVQARLTASTAAGKSVVIKLKRVSDNVTDLRIRVGTFGDESLSQLITDKMRPHL
jgi:uncharacterized protein YceK